MHVALQLFLEARIGFRAVSRVSRSWLWPRHQESAVPQTLINWVIRLSIVRLDWRPTGLAPEPGAFTNGLIWMIDLSIGLGWGRF